MANDLMNITNNMLVPDFPPSSIERVCLSYNARPGSLTEERQELFFAVEGMEYIVEFHKPDLDREMAQDNEKDFIRMFLEMEFSDEQAEMMDRRGFDINVMKIDLPNRKFYFINFNESELNQVGIKKKDKKYWAQNFSGRVFTWNDWEERQFIKDGKLEIHDSKTIRRYLHFVDEIKDIKPVLYDILPKFKAAAIHFKERYERVQGRPFDED